MAEHIDIVTTLRRESFYRPTSRINEFGKPQMGFELMSINLQAADEIERLREERDEARRLWCMAVEEIESGMTNDTRYEVAESKGWDCFNTPKSKIVKTLNGVVSEVKKSEPPKFDF